VTSLFFHGIVTGCGFPAAVFVVRYSDCSTNGISDGTLVENDFGWFVRE
jgi:hypothetical protein